MKKIKQIAIHFLVGLNILFLLFGCEIQEDFKYKYADDNSVLNMSALEFIRQNDSLSLLSQAIEIAEFEDLYRKDSEFTFIVPNNQAFRAYLKENSYSSISDIPLPILRNILRYHIVQETVNFNDLDLSPSNKPIAYMTENGQTLFLSHTSTYVGLVNEGTDKQWQIKTSNLVPTNGVIHVVSSIVFYSASTGDVDGVNPDLIQDTIFTKHDAYINGGVESSNNYGSDPLLKIKNVTDNGDYDRKAFLMFDFDELEKEGVVTDLELQLAVSFTHAKGVDLDIYETPSTSWTESSLNFDNAVFPVNSRISSIKTTEVSTFKFDLTDYYKKKAPSGLRSFMLDGEAGSDETDEIASKEHPSLPPPMLIATLASGDSELSLETLEDITVDQGGIFVLSHENIKVSGAAANDIIYTIEEVPKFGWLVKGAEVLKKGHKFSQLDLDLKNIIFIHGGNTSGMDVLLLTARDRAGAVLEDIELSIKVN